MELAVAHTVYNLAVGITNFIAEHDDKDAGREQISNIVVLIQNVIHPLLSHKITNTPLEKCLEGLQSVLTKTHQHMKMWKESRSHRLLAFINPSAVIQQLKEDREQLMDQYIMLMGAMQVIEHIKGYDPITPPTVHPSTVPKGKTKKVEGQASEVLDFWEKCIGSESGSVKSAYFCKQLASWLGTKPNAAVIQRLLLYLDMSKTGYVHLTALQNLVQDGNMREMINTYCAAPTLPLLIWISDDVKWNTAKVLSARKSGVTVLQIGSTSAAKTWLAINHEFLKKHDSPADIRFLSDEVRTEFSPEGVLFKNWRAGQEITRFIREEGFLAPILIHTAKGAINRTRYVQGYTMVGSMAGDPQEFQRYVGALAARRKDDTQWIKYGGS